MRRLIGFIEGLLFVAISTIMVFAMMYGLLRILA
jgi:hypothetical protein